MHIACSIYVLIAVSFLCTVLAQELGGDIDVVKLAKKVKKNIKNIRKLDTNLEDLNEEIADLGGKLNATTDDLNDLDEAVTGVEEKIEVFNGDVLKLDEKFTNADVEVEGKVSKINEEIADQKRLIENFDTNLEDQKRLIENFMEFNNIIDGYEYAFIKTELPWDTHEEAAITWGGHLASVHSDRETNFIVKRIVELNINFPYIGGQRIKNHTTDGSDETWKWSDGTNWDYTSWAPGQPNCYLDDNFQGTQDVVNLIVGGWNDVFPEIKYGGVYKRPYP